MKTFDHLITFISFLQKIGKFSAIFWWVILVIVSKFLF